MAHAEAQNLTVRAADLLSRQEKKFTLDMPESLHAKIKGIAAAHRMSAKDVVLEALMNYTIPKYTGKEVSDE